MNTPLQKWLKVSFFNLMIVAFLGIILRYKIAFALRFIDQKNLLNGHSHFAFAGWVTQALMILLVAYLSAQGQENSFKKYRFLLYANLVTAYGMLIAFPLQGYAMFSIIFSCLSVFVSYIFAVQFWRDLNKLPAHSIAHSWFKAAVFFNALSSVGVMGLAYIMVTKNNHPAVYLGSIYFYLHFQYNGWFFFACMGLLSALLIEHGVAGASLKNVYRLFTVACLPAYLLSVLWLPLPNWIYALMVVAVFLQIGGWLLLLGLISPFLTRIRNSTPPIAQKLLLLSGIAASIKLLLQAGSVIPSLSKLAFGFRPIVIGYLHLVLLGIITLFITGYVIAQNYISVSKLMVRGLAIFVLGILFNELLLMTQGIADIGYHVITNINGLLLLAAMLLLTGIALFNYGMQKSTK